MNQSLVGALCWLTSGSGRWWIRNDATASLKTDSSSIGTPSGTQASIAMTLSLSSSLSSSPFLQCNRHTTQYKTAWSIAHTLQHACRNEHMHTHAQMYACTHTQPRPPHTWCCSHTVDASDSFLSLSSNCTMSGSLAFLKWCHNLPLQYGNEES